MITVPKLALVGRPNVGKSTLFNRICGRRQAITDGRPGSTRDRNYAQVSWQGAGFELIDTGGLLLGSADPLLGPATEQARRAIDEADVVLLLVDQRAGLIPDDQAIAAELRRAGKRVLLVVNKVERGADGGSDGAVEFAPLGFAPVVSISAEHGIGVGDLLDAALEGLPRVALPEEGRPPARLALVGRPNVGKSSLLNRIVGAERALVSEIPGTTRDAVDSLVERDGERYLLVDTAGIRRVRQLAENVDHVSVVQARRAIERAEVVLVVIDAGEGIREMDQKIAGEVEEARRAVVLVVNKWDLSHDRGLRVEAFEAELRRRLKFLAWAPVVWTSARTGRGLGRVFAKAEQARRSWHQRVTTGELNRLLGRAVQQHTPRATSGSRPVKILYGTQVGVAPPTFVLSLNRPVDLHFSYRRYLENQIRAAFGFEGSPLVLKPRGRER